MNNDKKLFADGILLTVTTLALKTAGVLFSSRLTAVAGAEAMGLSAQITAAYAFAVTAASAGVNLGTMRLTSESRGAGLNDEIRPGVRCALSYCAVTGLTTALLLFIIAPVIGGSLIGTHEAILPLRILALAIPFIAASGAFHGYFNGVGRVWKSALVNVAEQAVRITLTLGGLYGITSATIAENTAPKLFSCISYIAAFASNSPLLLSIPAVSEFSNAGLACLAVVVGSVLSELFSFFFLLILYCFDRKRYNAKPQVGYGKNTQRMLGKKFLRITLPMAASALIRSGFSSAEHLFLPRGLRAFGSDSALAEYGIVCGMALPVILYPMALMNSFAQLNTVDIAARVSAGESRALIRSRVSRGISFALIYGVGCAAILRAFAYSLGSGIFKSTDAGFYISALSAYAVLSYLDHIADSMLKGLDCQAYVMKINILDSAAGLAFALFLVPSLGIRGYIISLYVCELINCLCSLGKLMSVTGFSPDPVGNIFIPGVCAALTVLLFSQAGVSLTFIAPSILAVAVFYFSAVLLMRKGYKRLYLHLLGN